MTGPRLSRRRFLTFTGMAGSAVLLSGCDAFDYLGSDDNAVRQVLEKANDLSYTVQRKLEGPGALAREYGESEIRQGQKPNGETNPPRKNMTAFAKTHSPIIAWRYTVWWKSR